MKISVIIPVYNKDQFVEASITSVLKQTYTNIEVIIIDDGSTDKSLEICRIISANDKRVRIITQDNRGVSAARNIGITECTGTWVYFLDADDYLDHNAFEIIIHELQYGDHIDAVEFGVKKLLNGKQIGLRVPRAKKTFSDSIKFFRETEMKPFSAWLHLMKRELIIQNNIRFDEDLKYKEDGLFMYKVLIKAQNVLVLDCALYNQVIVVGSATKSGVKKIQLLNNLQFTDRLISYTKNEGVALALQAELNQLFKYFFILLLSYKNLFKDWFLLQKTFNEVYDKHADILNSTYLKLARRTFLFLVVPLFIKNTISKKC